jgi:hypothetical protein
VVVKDFYLLLRATIMGAKSVSLPKILVNELSLTIIMRRMQATDGKQQAIDRPNCIHGMAELAFEKFV